MLRIRLIETFDLVTSGGACSCVLGSLTVVFFTVFLQRDLHFALGNFTVRFTIWGKEDREGEGVYENVLNLHSQHVSIVRQGFRWMTFTFSPLCHAPCAPGVLRMLSKCHWSRLQLTQILLCPSTRSYYTPPMFFHSSPFPRHCPGIPYVSSEGCWGDSCTREGRRGGN